MGNQKFYSYQCPCCGATMEISPDQKRLTCEYCGKKLTIAQNRATGQTELRKQTIQNTKNAIVIVVVIVSLLLLGSCVSCFTFIGGITSSSIQSSTRVNDTKEVDPFDKMENINACISGYAPYGKFNANKLSNSDIREIKYTVNKSTDLNNNDIVIVTALPMDGYHWTTTTKNITIDGLDTIIEAENQISEEDLNVLHDYCIEKVESDIRETLGDENYDSSDISLSIEPYKIYSSVSNDHNFYSIDPFVIFAAYKVDCEIKGVSGTFYKYVEIPNAVIRPNGTLKASYDKSSTTDGFIWVEDLGVKEYINYISGYLTVLEMESSLEREGCTLHRISDK